MERERSFVVKVRAATRQVDGNRFEALWEQGQNVVPGGPVIKESVNEDDLGPRRLVLVIGHTYDSFVMSYAAFVGEKQYGKVLDAWF
jgi:hypothetical protein